MAGAPCKVSLELQPIGVGCKLFIDGIEIKQCRRVTVDAEVDKMTLVTLELIDVEVSVRGEVAEIAETSVPGRRHRQINRAHDFIETSGLDARNHMYAVAKD